MKININNKNNKAKMVSSTNCVIEIRDIKMVYKTCGDCLNFLKPE